MSDKDVVATKDSVLKSLPKIQVPPEKTKEDVEETKTVTNETINVSNANTTAAEQVQYNRRALKEDAKTYELEKFEKHTLLIFNQKEFINRSPRLGTEHDVRKLTDTFTKLGFEVKVENNLTLAEIQTTLKEFSEQDFTDYGCVAVAVLTHGADLGLIRAKDKPYNESEIFEHFKVDRRPTLVTKPKIFIIQACRGKGDSTGVFTSPRGPTSKDEDDEKEVTYSLPVESDMLVLHSSYFGKPSWRDHLNGSWFIQALCTRIDDLAKTHDLESILIEVKRVVAIDLCDETTNALTTETETNKQMPVMTSTLIRKLYLRKKGELPGPIMSPVIDPGTILMDRSLSIANSRNTCTTCFLKHFLYLRHCMKLYLEDHPEDTAADAMYKLALTYEDSEEFNEVKEEMTQTISTFFDECASFPFSKFIHRYNSEL